MLRSTKESQFQDMRPEFPFLLVGKHVHEISALSIGRSVSTRSAELLLAWTSPNPCH